MIIFLYSVGNPYAGIIVRALSISKEHGNKLIESLRIYGWLDTSRHVMRYDEIIEVPIINNLSENDLKSALPEELVDNFKLIIRSGPSMTRIKSAKPPFNNITEKCKKTLGLTDSELGLLPSKWELLGDVLVLRLPVRLKKKWRSIASIYAEILNARSVLRRIDKVKGVLRQPGVELLFGDEQVETTHMENKVAFRIDPLRIMFSSGNIDERIRISKLAQPQDTVVDMFAGIGYFCLPMAVHSKPQKIIACELNPVAFEYLNTNIELNHVGHIVETKLGDNRKEIPEGIADRIVMGYIKSEDSHRVAAIRILKPTGGIVHFHDVGFHKDVRKSAMDKFNDSLKKSDMNKKYDIELLNFYKIKSYGPKLDHVVLDISVKPR